MIEIKGSVVDLSESIKDAKNEKERIEILKKELKRIKEENEKQDGPEKIKHVKFNYVKKDGTKRHATIKPLTIEENHLKGIDWDRTEKDELEHHKQRTFILANIS